MTNNKKTFSQKALLPVCGLIAAFIVGCATPKMADIPAGSEPRAEIAKLDSDLSLAVTKNVDVLASEEYKKSRNYFDKAQTDLKNEKPQQDILDSVRISKAFLNDAYTKAANRETQAMPLFESRQMALRAGAGSIAELQKDLSTLDSKVSGISADLPKTSAEKIANLQSQYVGLEQKAVVLTQLGQSIALVNGAKKDNAKKLAPVSLKNAELSLKNAESIISTNVRNPEGYKVAVMNARQDATQLSNVMTTIAQNGKTLSETAAIKMVAQTKTIAGLEKNIAEVATQSQAELEAIQLENEKLAKENSSKNTALNQATQKVQLQRALERARSQFTAAEAEAYQQGDNLVIRLKQVNFASGKSDLPPASLPLLAKVLNVAKTLNSSQVVVEGHTDSIGGEVANKTISESRASAVAEYLKANGLSSANIEAEGFGFSKPIADNKSKEGRALNRRVDIILTPSDVK